MPETTVVSGSSTSALVPAGELITLAANVTGGPIVPLASSRGKERVTFPSSSEDVGESDSEPSAPPAWRLRPYDQPLLNEEMIEDALQAPRHVKVDRITRSLSHCVSLIAALDAAELKHDEELESSRLKLRISPKSVDATGNRAPQKSSYSWGDWNLSSPKSVDKTGDRGPSKSSSSYPGNFSSPKSVDATGNRVLRGRLTLGGTGTLVLLSPWMRLGTEVL
ncbi:hypothetical protein CJ030_MR1G001453 [Morella rubra]|uniref:Uncharacterized protein n=1 Tax=Morella rubra TaxID=262757 RepID=A0A6A1WRZ3_9ROSI|nr:hypothetical protein CJ030_MR1G001453 [Morella rubra]